MVSASISFVACGLCFRCVGLCHIFSLFFSFCFLVGRAFVEVYKESRIKDMGMDGKIFGYNSMSCASSSLKSLIEDSLSDDMPFPVPPFSWSLNASSVAYFLT